MLGGAQGAYSEYSRIIYKVLPWPWKCWDSQKSCRNALIKEHNGNVNSESSPGGSGAGGELICQSPLLPCKLAETLEQLKRNLSVKYNLELCFWLFL